MKSLIAITTMLATTMICAALLAADAPESIRAPAGTAESRQAQTQPDKKAAGDPYTLSTCIVSGEKLGSMGEPVVKKIDGREVRFCCGGCIRTFEKSKDEYLKKIDEQIIKDQEPLYPLKTCVVETDDLLFDADGKFTGVNYVHNNRLIRFCCGECIEGFKADPDKFIAKLNEAVAKQQGEDYPLMTCPVSGEALGSMGKPIEKVVANRLVRFCCSGCTKELEKNPAAVIAKIDEARKAKTSNAGGKANQ